MGKFKKPSPKTFRCENCGRSFVNERALGQHLDSKTHVPQTKHDEEILPIIHTTPITLDTPEFQSVEPKAMKSNKTPEKDELSRKDDATAKSYILTPIPGKGQGLIAAHYIPKGTRILSEKPLFEIPKSGPKQSTEKTVEKKFRLLSQHDQEAFLSLYNHTPDDSRRLAGIVKTNALPLGSDATVGGIFPIISRINHDCRPNTQHTWNSSTKHETIHAIRDIQEGEEITISYNLGGPSQSRIQQMRSSFGFSCTCDLCSLTGEALEMSNKRQLQIQALDDEIGNPYGVMENPGNALAHCRMLLLLYEMEAITDARVARVYYDAFQICVTHSDQARASIFAQKAYETRLYLEGEDSPYTQKAKSFMANPAKHMSFGISQRWKHAKKEIPKNLTTQELDQWLWLPANRTDESREISSSFEFLIFVSILRELMSL